jgi:hypothetical protein
MARRDDSRSAEKARKAGDTARIGAGTPWRVRGGAHSSSMEKERISERASGAVRGLRDRLTG